MEPLVTVGICVRNGEKMLGDAVNSVINQDFPRDLLQIVFVDDGSKDKTPEIISDFVSRLGDQAKCITTSWRGLGSARQTIVENASGTYIVWVDCDMVLSRDFIHRQVEFMDANPTVGIGKGRYGVDRKENLVATLENMDFLIDFPGEIETKSKSLGTGGCIYRLKAIKEAGGFDKNIKGAGEDMDAENRIREKGWKLYITNAVFFEKRRETWKSLWDEYFWRGCSWQMLANKNREMVNLAKLLPPVAVMVELTKVPTAYKLTHQKKAFLLPLHYIFKRVAWFLGFLKSPS
jgi:glycosyltransferase involved in cell wall biosynthesis